MLESSTLTLSLSREERGGERRTLTPTLSRTREREGPAKREGEGDAKREGEGGAKREGEGGAKREGEGGAKRG